jgi:hypothetical protein
VVGFEPLGFATTLSSQREDPNLRISTKGLMCRMAEAVSNAFRAAETGRPGAAFVSLPMDIMVAGADVSSLTPPAFGGPGPADGAALVKAARLINSAENPVVLLGMLASRPANADAQACGTLAPIYCTGKFDWELCREVSVVPRKGTTHKA